MQGMQPRQGTVCSVNTGCFREWSGGTGTAYGGKQPLFQSTFQGNSLNQLSYGPPQDTQKGWTTSHGLASLIQ